MSAPVDLLRLFADHRPGLIAYAMAITRDRTVAEDVVQDAWIRLQTSQAILEADRPAAFLYRTVRNLALDHGRRLSLEKRRFVQPTATVAAIAVDEPDPEAAAAAREELKLTLEALRALPVRMGEAVRLHRLEGLRLKDIAERLGVSTTVAHGLVVEGVDRCRRALRERGRRK